MKKALPAPCENCGRLFTKTNVAAQVKKHVDRAAAELLKNLKC